MQYNSLFLAFLMDMAACLVDLKIDKNINSNWCIYPFHDTQYCLFTMIFANWFDRTYLALAHTELVRASLESEFAGLNHQYSYPLSLL